MKANEYMSQLKAAFPKADAFYEANKNKDTKVIKHYYCNCGDSDYYMQDVTPIEVTDCEEFEEV